jgi:Holliday junction resolvase-like predicted endonuclease
MIQTNFLHKLLQSNSDTVNVSELTTETGINSDEITSYLQELQRLGLIHSTKNRIFISPYQKVQLALLAIRYGSDIEDVSQALDWREFEDIAIKVLTHNGFCSLKHYRFKSQNQRHEIDVLSFKNPLILAIECKHWKHSWQNAVIKRIVDKQLERGTALSQLWQSKPKIHPSMLPSHKHLTILPLILTLHLTPLKSYNNVPIIPIFYFQNFLSTELYTHLPNFRTYDIFNN